VKIIITGGEGSIGSELKRQLEKDHTVFSYGIKSGNDVCNTSNLMAFMERNKPDVVYHLASLKDANESIQKEWLYLYNNVYGTLSVLYCMEKLGINKIIFSSSAGVYGESDKPVDENYKLEPANPYGVSKVMSERLIRNSSVGWVILRYFNVVGTGGLVDLCKKHKQEGKQISIYGNSVRDYIDIKEVARISVKALNWDNGIVNVGTGVGKSSLEVAESVGVDYIQKPPREEVSYSVADITKLEKLLVI
jgi:UDP-glucose 4-epimerase